VLSVYFQAVRSLSERDKQLGDMLARQAADLIESRAHHERVQELNDTLRRRSAELEASQEQLSRQADDLEEQDRHRQEFLAALGHELRNPMAAIQSSLTLLTAADDRSRRGLDVLHRQMRHMARLVNDLLDVTRVTHGGLHLHREPIDIGQAVKEALDVIRERADNRGLGIRSELPRAPLHVQADAERVAQILDNLLGKALIYTDGGTVSVTVCNESDMARVTVRDTGIGISADDMKALFEPYRRGGDKRRGEGLGLGLALAKALVEAHGGSIECHSDGPGAGSEFSFTLPLAAAAPATATVADRRLPAKRRILVVDDQRDVADMFGALLESLGQEAVVAYDGESALSLAREHAPDVAFLDISMPNMSGAELAKRMRQLPQSNVTVLVALTGHDKVHAGVLDGEFDRHMLKPVSEASLIALLHSIAQPAGGRTQVVPDSSKPS
jgi:signal transduction histidine kinase